MRSVSGLSLSRRSTSDVSGCHASYSNMTPSSNVSLLLSWLGGPRCTSRQKVPINYPWESFRDLTRNHKRGLVFLTLADWSTCMTDLNTARRGLAIANEGHIQWFSIHRGRLLKLFHGTVGLGGGKLRAADCRDMKSRRQHSFDRHALSKHEVISRYKHAITSQDIPLIWRLGYNCSSVVACQV